MLKQADRVLLRRQERWKTSTAFTTQRYCFRGNTGFKLNVPKYFHRCAPAQAEALENERSMYQLRSCFCRRTASKIQKLNGNSGCAATLFC